MDEPLDDSLDRATYPGADDKLFSAGSDWHTEARPGAIGEEWWLLASGYDEAADVIAREVLSQAQPHYRLVYPLVFLYRHAVEVRLKDIINLSEQCHGGSEVPHIGHRLEELWAIAKPKIEMDSYGIEPPTIRAVERIVQEFADWDPGSFHFRYPTDTKGKAVQYRASEFDARAFIQTARRTLNVLNHIANGLGEDLYGDGPGSSGEYTAADF